jgi:hypothetical protein
LSRTPSVRLHIHFVAFLPYLCRTITLEIRTGYKEKPLPPGAGEAAIKKYKEAAMERARRRRQAVKGNIKSLLEALEDDIRVDPEGYKDYFNKIVDRMAGDVPPRPATSEREEPPLPPRFSDCSLIPSFPGLGDVQLFRVDWSEELGLCE